MSFKRQLESSLAKSFVFYILIFSSFVALINTSIQLFYEYKRDINAIQRTADQIEKSHKSTITQALWAYDSLILESQLKGINNLPGILYSCIKKNDEILKEIGERHPDQKAVSYEYVLKHTVKNKEHQLGTLEVKINLSDVYEHLWDRVVLILITQTLKTFFVSLFILFLFYFLIGRHLNVMADFAKSLNINNLKNNKLILNRKGGRSTESDELGLVESALNGMRIKLLDEMKNVQRTQDALKESESDLKASQRIAHLGSWRLNIETNEVFWTDELYRMYGFDPALPPPPYSEHMKLFTPESWQRLSLAIEKTRETGIPYEIELEMIKENKTKGWLWVRGETIKDSTGNIIGLWGAAQDITDRKRNEEKLSLQSEIITRMSEGVSLVNEAGVIVYTNPAFERIFGYSAGEMNGIHVSSLNAPSEKTPAEAADEILKSLNDKGSWIGEIKNIKKDGTYFWSSATVTILEHPKYGKAFISVQTDISELKHTQNEKKTLESKLQQAQKMESIGNLAGGIAHDFNNLLFPILGMSEMLLEDLPKDSLEHENAREIFHAGKRAGDLVQQILAFSRQSEHKVTPVRIQNVLKEVLKLTRSTIPSNIEIKDDIQPDCGLVMADPTQIHQIAMNLITNASHAVESKNGIINIELEEITIETNDFSEPELPPGSYIRFSVSDNGIGIPKNAINKIFEPYFTTKVKGKGTGLGLAVVYGIVKECSGDIKVFSEIGKGTTFNIYLPLMEKSSEIITNVPVNASATGKENILLVDDEESVASLEGQILSRLGYQVTVKTSSTDALEAFKANPSSFDLVISDMTMPNMTGDQLAKEIFSVSPNTPIIICTGFSERINNEQKGILGVKGFLMKPVLKADLARTVREVLDKARKGTGFKA